MGEGNDKLSSDNKQSSSSGSSSQQEQDDEASLRMLNAKRMLELRKRASLATSSNSQQSSKQIPKVPSDKEILQRALVDRGDEVLATAEANYPSEMRILIPRLANLIKQGKVTTLTGGELL